MIAIVGGGITGLALGRELALRTIWALAGSCLPAWDRSWSALEGLRLPTGIHVAANWESRPGLAGRLAQTRSLAADLDRHRAAGATARPAGSDASRPGQFPP